jgi:hypothetical protein
MKLIREHNDFDWVNNDNNLNGVKIKTPVGKTVITIIDDGGRTVLLTWGEGGRYSSEYDRKTVESFIARGTWTLTESTDDFDWIRDTVPAIDEYNPPKRGDVLICLPGYHADPNEQSELDDPEAAGFGYANGRIIVVGEVEPNLHYPEGKRIVVWPDEEKSKLYWHDDNVCEDCGIYGLALTYYMGDKLNESDDFDWIRDIEPGIELKPNTMYYFEPKLTVDEVERFANVISNSDYLKNWMLTKVISRMSGDRLGDNMSYFVTNDSIDEMVSGWCLTSNPHQAIRDMYDGYDFVDARKRFNF